LRYLKLKSRFSAPVFRFALLAVLVAGLATIPSRLSAQQPTPDPTAAQAPAAQAPRLTLPRPKKRPRLSRKSSTSIVTLPSCARLPRCSPGPGSTAKLFEFINFAIIALAVLIPLSRIFPKIIRKRSQTVRHDIDSARKMTEDANARLSAIESKLSGLDVEIARFALKWSRKASRTKCHQGHHRRRERPIVAAASRKLAWPPHRQPADCATLPPTWPSSRPPSSWFLRGERPGPDRRVLSGVAADGAHQSDHRGGQN